MLDRVRYVIYRESQKKVYTKNKILSITNLNFYHLRRVREKILYNFFRFNFRTFL